MPAPFWQVFAEVGELGDRMDALLKTQVIVHQEVMLRLQVRACAARGHAKAPQVRECVHVDQHVCPGQKEAIESWQLSVCACACV